MLKSVGEIARQSNAAIDQIGTHPASSIITLRGSQLLAVGLSQKYLNFFKTESVKGAGSHSPLTGARS